MEQGLPAIPAKRYFTIGEVSELCGVKPYVLRYWEQEFAQLKPMKRRGNRRYYQHHEVLLIRRIRELLYEQGFTISGARRLVESHPGRHDRIAEPEHERDPVGSELVEDDGIADLDGVEHAGLDSAAEPGAQATDDRIAMTPGAAAGPALSLEQVRQELIAIRLLLKA